MSIQDKLRTVYTQLNTIEGAKVYHYEKPEKQKAPYVVWMEDSTESFNADNRRGEYQVHGTIDVYSQTEFDALFDAVPNVLDNAELLSVQYEDGLIHYEYEFSV